MVSIETFAAVDAALQDEKKVGVSVGIRTLIDGNVPPIGADAETLSRYIWAHRHSITEECIWGSGRTHHPTILFFDHAANGGAAVSMHCFHLTPMFIVKDRPLNFLGTIDDDVLEAYGEDQIVYFNNREFAVCELSPANKRHPARNPLNRSGSGGIRPAAPARLACAEFSPALRRAGECRTQSSSRGRNPGRFGAALSAMSVLTAYYDLKCAPPTFDIVAFLCAVERQRRQRGCDAVAIEILPGPVGGFREDNLWPHSIAERWQMLHRVAVPMAWMLPHATVRVCDDRPPHALPLSIGWQQSLYGLKLQLECMAAGVRPLRPAADPVRNPRLVTMTLREAEHWPQRNSNAEAWRRAGEIIAAHGFEVVVVREARFADMPLGSLRIDAAASRDLNARASLYRSASCNLFVSNGPAWFALALDAPVLMLKPTTENLMGTCSAHYFRSCGIEHGAQLPGAPPGGSASRLARG